MQKNPGESFVISPFFYNFVSYVLFLKEKVGWHGFIYVL